MTRDRCTRVRPLLDSFVDGELSAEAMADVGQHLEDCELCAEVVRLTEALKNSTRRAVRADTEISLNFEQRVREALQAEREREERAPIPLNPNAISRAVAEAKARHPMWAAVAAAAAVLFWFQTQNSREQQATQSSAPTPSAFLANSTSTSVDSLDDVLDELVSYHNAPPAPQVREPQLVPEFGQDVGVPVSLPSLQQFGAEWRGGTVVPLGQRMAERAAYLRYRLSGHDVTLYVYNPNKTPIRERLKRHLVVRNLPVSLGQRQGYWIAASEHDGVGYAVATDLNDLESAELVTAIH